MKEVPARNGGKFMAREKGDPALPGAGRPPGIPNAATRLKRLLSLVIEKVNPVSEGLEKEELAYFLDLSLIHKALNGDVQAYREIMDRIEGKSVSKVETKEVTEFSSVTPLDDRQLKALSKAFGDKTHTRKSRKTPQT